MGMMGSPAVAGLFYVYTVSFALGVLGGGGGGGGATSTSLHGSGGVVTPASFLGLGGTAGTGGGGGGAGTPLTSSTIGGGGGGGTAFFFDLSWAPAAVPSNRVRAIILKTFFMMLVLGLDAGTGKFHTGYLLIGK